MSSLNVQYIVPLNHFAEHLQMALQRLGVQRKVPFLEKQLENAPAYEIVYAMFKLNLEERMLWINSDWRNWWEVMEDVMGRHISGWMSESQYRPVHRKGAKAVDAELTAEDERIIDYYDAIYTDVLDPLWLMMENMIGQQMGIAENTWDMFTLERRDTYQVEKSTTEEEVWIPDRIATVAIDGSSTPQLRPVQINSPVSGQVQIRQIPIMIQKLDRIDLKLSNMGDFRIREWEENIKSGKWKTRAKENMDVHSLAPDHLYGEANRGSLAEIRRAGKTGGIRTLGK